MRRNNIPFTTTEKCVMAVTLLMLLLAVITGALQPYFESQAYNRLTGAQTTYWDAAFLELRVQEQPKSSK